MPTNAALDLECAVLCRQVFACEPLAAWSKAYGEANAVVFGSGASFDRVERAVREGWDLEALELAWRRHDKANPLTKKLNILFYIVECSPPGYGRFVDEGGARASAWMALVGLTLRSGYKLLKGRVLLGRVLGGSR